MDMAEQNKKLIECLKGYETVTFSIKGVKEVTFETTEFKEAIRWLEHWWGDIEKGEQ